MGGYPPNFTSTDSRQPSENKNEQAGAAQAAPALISKVKLESGSIIRPRNDYEGFFAIQGTCHSHELMTALIFNSPEMFRLLNELDCACSVSERVSGHKVGCIMPEIKELLEKIEGKVKS